MAKATNEKAPNETEKASTTAPVATTPVRPSETEMQKDYDLQRNRTKEILDAEPKIAFMIPLGPDEKEGAYETVMINGYGYQIMKNVLVEIPRSVAQLLANKYKVSSEAGRNMLVDAKKDRMEALT